MSGSSWMTIGAASGALAVALGAFGTHGIAPSPEALEKMAGVDRAATERRLATYETAARYQMYHALALLFVSLMKTVAPGPRPWTLDASGWAFLAGSVIFCGTLYGIGVGGPRWLGAITPIGGVGLILGWAFLAWSRVGPG